MARYSLRHYGAICCLATLTSALTRDVFHSRNFGTATDGTEISKCKLFTRKFWKFREWSGNFWDENFVNLR